MSLNPIVHEIDIAVPIQIFKFDFVLIGKSDISFIREFVLRLLWLNDMSPENIADFMGLSIKELRVAINQLISLNEVEVTKAGKLHLTPISAKYFENADNLRPDIRTLFEGTLKLKFELLNYSHVMLREIDNKNHERAIVLRPDPVLHSESVMHAKNSFIHSYMEIFERDSVVWYNENDTQKKGKFSKGVELYKLSDVVKLRESYLRIKLFLTLDVQRNSLEHYTEHELFENETITDAVNNHINNNETRQNILDVANAMHLFGDKVSIECIKNDGFDFSKFMTLIEKKDNYFIGLFTLSHNWKKIGSIIEQAIDEQLRKNNVSDSKILSWITPCDDFWLTSNTSYEVITKLFEKAGLENCEIFISMNFDKSKEYESSWKNTLGNLRACAHKFLAGFLKGAVEMLIVRDTLALVIYHLQIPGEPITFPFGFFVEKSEKVNEYKDVFISYLNGYSDDKKSRDFGYLIPKEIR